MEKMELGKVTRWGKVPAWWLMHPEIDADRFAVLAALATYADENGFCEPSQGTLAKRLCRSRPWANRVVADLAAIGLLRKQTRARPNGGTTSCRYQLAQSPEQAEAFVAHGAAPEMAVVVRTRAGHRTDTPCQRDDTNHLDLEHIQNSRPDAPAAPAPAPTHEQDTLTSTSPDNVQGSPSREWLPSEETVAEALRLCPEADLDEHTARFVARCRAKGYRYASLEDAWLEWLLSDRRATRHETTTGSPVAAFPSRRAERPTARAEHRFDRFEAWATSASAPFATSARC
jgi:hypothetical protein